MTTNDETTTLVELPQRVWQAVEYLLADHLDELPEYREAFAALRGENDDSPEEREMSRQGVGDFGDELDFARETLGESATEDEVADLAHERAVIAARERAALVGDEDDYAKVDGDDR